MRAYWAVLVISLSASSRVHAGGGGPPPKSFGWTELGPGAGGRLIGVFARKLNNGVRILVSSPGGGVWRTDTGGPPWQFAPNVGLSDYSTGYLEADVLNPARVYLETRSNLYATTDDASTWTGLDGSGGAPAALDQTGGAFRTLAQMNCNLNKAAPSNTSRVFRGPACLGFSYSTKSGAPGSFTYVTPFPSGNVSNCIGSMAADPVTGRVYFTAAGNNPVQVWRSKSGCNWCSQVCDDPAQPNHGWELASTGLPVNASVITAMVWTGTADHLSLLSRMTTGTNGAEFHTADAGATWQQGGVLPFSSPNASALLWAGGKLMFAGGISPYVSADGGASWHNPVGKGLHPDTRAFYADAALGKLYAVTDGTSGGSSNISQWDWTGPAVEPSNQAGIGHAGLTILSATGISYLSVGGHGRMFLASWDNGMFCSDDTGATWKPNQRIVGGDMYSVMIHPVNTNRAYAMSNQGVARADNYATAASCDAISWNCPVPGGDCESKQLYSFFSGPNATAVDPRAKQEDVVAFGKVGSVLVSTDGGVTWATSKPAYGSVESVYFDDGGFLYAGIAQRGLYRCTKVRGESLVPDYCVAPGSWQKFGLNNTPPDHILDIKVTHPLTPANSNPTFWMATSDGLYRKVPGLNLDWTKVTGGGGYVVNQVTTVPLHPQCVYAGFGFINSIVQHRGGVQFSSDNGATWTGVTAGYALHNVPISQLVPDPADPHRIWAATYGRGAWALEWGNQLPAACGGP